MKPRIFFSYFDSWGTVRVAPIHDIQDVPNDKISVAPWGPKLALRDGSVVKRVGESKVYVIFGDKLHWIESEDAFLSLGYTWESVRELMPEVLVDYTDGDSITKGSVSGTDNIVKEEEAKLKFTKKLILGMHDEEVGELKKLLFKHGYLSPLDSTSFFDGATKDAVKKFQLNFDLEDVGVVGPRTRGVLNNLDEEGNLLISDDVIKEIPNPEMGRFKNTFTYGDTHPDIREIKIILFNMGHFTLKSKSSNFSTNFEEALIKFQKANGLEQTGVVDEYTRRALNRL